MWASKVAIVVAIAIVAYRHHRIAKLLSSSTVFFFIKALLLLLTTCQLESFVVDIGGCQNYVMTASLTVK